MAASGLLSRSKFLVVFSANHLNSLCLSRLLSSSFVRASRCVFFSENNSKTGDLWPCKANCAVNGARNFTLQSWLGVKASVLTEEKINKADIGCPICSRDITFTYKDVLFLSQFMSPRGYILNRRVTGVCRKQQRKLEKAIKISQRLDDEEEMDYNMKKLGLLPKLAPVLQKEQEERRLAEKKKAAESKA